MQGVGLYALRSNCSCSLMRCNARLPLRSCRPASTLYGTSYWMRRLCALRHHWCGLTQTGLAKRVRCILLGASVVPATGPTRAKQYYETQYFQTFLLKLMQYLCICGEKALPALVFCGTRHCETSFTLGRLFGTTTDARHAAATNAYVHRRHSDHAQSSRLSLQHLHTH
jgi:hypothetical protein